MPSVTSVISGIAVTFGGLLGRTVYDPKKAVATEVSEEKQEDTTKDLIPIG